MIELLAPAGDPASFRAALQAGADAVYLGAQSFGARASAGFSLEDLQDALKTAHLHGRRVYVTVNTLVKEGEFEALTAQLRLLDQLRVDAVLVQDLGALRFIKRELPDLPVHASTQMSVHNAQGAGFLLSQGVGRVVLARECSLDTIRAVAETGIQTEVFVHGALCVAVSGQCLMSSQIGGRSGNRGRCAQPCRLGYSYRGKAGNWLSPRDLNLLEKVPELVKAGVSSLKIEGRLKRPEYVTVVTKAYRNAIEAAIAGRVNTQLAQDQEALLQVFNRGGFTKGPAFGGQDAKLINPLRVSHEGLLLGQVKSCQRKGAVYLSEVFLLRDLQNGDNLQIRDAQGEQEMIYAGPPVSKGQSTVIRHYRPTVTGGRVFRLVDALQISAAQQERENPLPAVSLSASLTAVPCEKLTLRLSDGEVETTTAGEIPQTAQSSPMTLESTQRSITKTGGSGYKISDYAFHSDAPLFATAAQLNALRRQALEDFTAARLANWRREDALPRHAMARPAPLVGDAAPSLYVRCCDLSLRNKLRQAGATHFLFSPQDYEKASLRDQLKTLEEGDIFCLPPQANEQTLADLHAMCHEPPVSVMLDNVGQLALDWPGPVMAGAGIPAWNAESLAFLRECGVQSLIFSRELSSQDVEALPTDSVRPILPVYGRGRLMLLNHCPERVYRGLDGDKRNCRLCAAGEGTLGRGLRDRLGETFPLCPIRLSEGCLNIVVHNRPLHLSRKAIGTGWLLDFTTETAEEMLAITAYYAALLRGERDLPALDIPYYLGRFEAGVV